MKSAFWIGYYGFLETIRNRLLLGVALLILPMFLGAWMLDVYNLDLQVKFIKDLALNVVSGYGLLIVVIISLDQLLPDIEKRTIYFILTRTLSRQEYLFGRFFGVVSSLGFYHAVTCGTITLFLRLYFGAWFTELPVGVFVIFLKQTLLVSVILLLSSCTSKIIVLSIGTLSYVVGHFFDVLRMWAERKGSGLLAMGVEAFAFLLPDFSLFEPRIGVVHEIQISLEPFLFLCFYSCVLSAFYLMLGGTILSRRDL